MNVTTTLNNDYQPVRRRERLYSTAELANCYNESYNTMQKRLRQLEQEGKITGTKIKGTRKPFIAYSKFQVDQHLNNQKKNQALISNEKSQLMTTDKICKILKCDKATLFRNWREIETVVGATTVKIIRHGEQTYWDEKEQTLLLEKMKSNTNNQHNLPQTLQPITTTLSRDLQVDILFEQIKKIHKDDKAELIAIHEKEKSELREIIKEKDNEISNLKNNRKWQNTVKKVQKLVYLLLPPPHQKDSFEYMWNSLFSDLKISKQDSIDNGYRGSISAYIRNTPHLYQRFDDYVDSIIKKHNQQGE